MIVRSALCALLLVVASTVALPIASASALVAVDGGPVVGFENDNVTQYLGVPYATAGRFAAPTAVTPWTAPYSAVAHGNQCPQAPFPIDVDVPSGVGLPVNDENCLSVDLYVPENAEGRRLPVMVYLYGGAYVIGANWQYDSPSELVKNGDVIVAIPNYRVGPFGFLALPELAAESGGATGTYGTQDQQFALRWVQRNIAAFGGDPANVTLFGESAGGMSVCTQLASPTAKGLFSKAIVQSGPCSKSPLVPPTKDVAYKRSSAYAIEMGCSDVATRLDCLRHLPIPRLLDSSTTKFDSPLATWTPILDGVVLDRTPEDALGRGSGEGIPIMIGSNADEGRFFVALFDYANGRIPTASSYADDIGTVYPDRAKEVLANYPLVQYDSPASALAAVWTDSLFACPSLFTGRSASEGGSPVWQYEFAEAPLGSNPVLPGSFHAAEIPYLFSRLGGVPVPWTGRSATLAAEIKLRWSAFAHNGSPNSDTVSQWSERTSGEQVLRIDSISSVMADGFAARHKCNVWE